MEKEEETDQGVQASADSHPLSKAPVIDTYFPPQGGRGANSGAQAGGINPVIPQGQGDEGVLTGCYTIKGLLVGNSWNGSNALSILDML